MYHVVTEERRLPRNGQLSTTGVGGAVMSSLIPVNLRWFYRGSAVRLPVSSSK